MTVVNIDLRSPSPAGPVPAAGRVSWQAVERSAAGGYVVLPARTSVELAGGVAQVLIEPGVYWFTESAAGGEDAFRVVPAVGPVVYASLAAVDPVTLETGAAPVAAWYAYTDTLEATALDAATSAEASRVAATGSQTSAQASATAAGNSATAAAGSATAASGSATTAAARVTDATTQAGLAGNPATAAGNSATAAAGSATAANTSKLDAQTAASGATLARDTMVNGGSVDGAGRLILGRVNAAPVDAGYVVGPPNVLTVVGTETGPETPGATGATGLTGAKGDPGGFTLGTLLGAADLNTIKTSGLYRQDVGANATAPNNYPRVGNGGVLMVQVMATDYLIQTYEPLTGFTAGPPVLFKRYLNGAVWSSWRAFASQRVGTTAGRAIYTWDDVNFREQLIYGDTGSREISALLDPAKVVGQAWLRRTGYSVTINFHAMAFLASAAGQTPFMAAAGLGSNYRPTQLFRGSLMTANTFESRLIEVGLDGAVTMFNPTNTAGYSGSITYQTWDPWPTTLPGNANGAAAPNL